MLATSDIGLVVQKHNAIVKSFWVIFQQVGTLCTSNLIRAIAFKY
ncbi:hypothetical protein [Nostoc sp.]